MTIFGKLEQVTIREGWPREDTGFTRWLAQPENLSTLGEELNIPLEHIETESRVGAYRLDILARRCGTEENVVIESQFGATDHGHFGQLLTYASGVRSDGSGAKTIIWIAESFNEPHRAALDWLNKSTEPGIRFFGVEIQLWRIGNSALAPKFSIVSRPNDWQKELSRETSSTGLYDLYFEFWQAFIKFCGESTTLQIAPAQHEHWIGTSIGRPGFGVNLSASKRARRLECQLWIDHSRAKVAYAILLEQRDNIRDFIGQQVEFLESRNTCKIFEASPGDVTDRTQWPDMHHWLRERGELYASFFGPRIRGLDLD